MSIIKRYLARKEAEARAAAEQSKQEPEPEHAAASTKLEPWSKVFESIGLSGDDKPRERPKPKASIIASWDRAIAAITSKAR